MVRLVVATEQNGGSARGYPAGSVSLTAWFWRSAIVLTWILCSAALGMNALI
jgi:hypothetical protein